jgi:hypothetical protein
MLRTHLQEAGIVLPIPDEIVSTAVFMHAPLSAEAIRFPTPPPAIRAVYIASFPMRSHPHYWKTSAGASSLSSELLVPPSNRLNLAVQFLNWLPPLLLVPFDLSDLRTGTSGRRPHLVGGLTGLRLGERMKAVRRGMAELTLGVRGPRLGSEPHCLAECYSRRTDE